MCAKLWDVLRILRRQRCQQRLPCSYILQRSCHCLLIAAPPNDLQCQSLLSPHCRAEKPILEHLHALTKLQEVLPSRGNTYKGRVLHGLQTRNIQHEVLCSSCAPATLGPLSRYCRPHHMKTLGDISAVRL